MAAQTGRRTTKYATRGNLACDPAWKGSTAAAPSREEVLRPRPRVRPKERTLARPRITVRKAGKVSPFAVVGFLTIGALTALLLMYCARLAVIGNENVQLRKELSNLQEEGAKLMAQYELAYDLQAIEAELTADGTMMKPNSNQMIILDLSEPDNVVIYDKEDNSVGILEKIKNLFKNLW